jgi:hypothetical protein
MDRIIINDLSFVDTHNIVLRRSKKYIAICMNEIEDTVNSLSLSETEKAKLIKDIRKSILDNVNELTRSLLRDIFTGSVEGTGIY